MKKQTKNLQVHSIVGIDSTVEGTYRTKGSARIDGTIVGNVYAEETIFIGEKGRITGNIYAVIITVSGKVDGDLYATEKVEIESTGNIKGDIYTPSIVIDENAIFQGKCLMNQKNKVTSDDSGKKAIAK